MQNNFINTLCEIRLALGFWVQGPSRRVRDTVPLRVVHLGRSSCHAISGRGDELTRINFHGLEEGICCSLSLSQRLNACPGNTPKVNNFAATLPGYPGGDVARSPRKALRWGISKSMFTRFVNFCSQFATKCLQERGNGSKTGDGIPPHRAFCGF